MYVPNILKYLNGIASRNPQDYHLITVVFGDLFLIYICLEKVHTYATIHVHTLGHVIEHLV